MRILGALIVIAAIAAPPLQDSPFDILITNARLLDGSGNPWLREDLAIRGDRIVARGRLTGSKAARVIDAKGLVVAPGFIDVHSHAVGALRRPELRDARVLLAQGVTTIVGNPDGGGPIDIATQRQSLESDGIGVNVALLIGHGSVRGSVLGNAIREPDAAELDRMK
ncbi:MAG TPA: amidohydrolase family protein, partial [Vicinamibacterales bacterium]|nr:amidohydrolase family protein [Vicinamibacterales bacterium]